LLHREQKYYERSTTGGDVIAYGGRGGGDSKKAWASFDFIFLGQKRKPRNLDLDKYVQQANPKYCLKNGVSHYRISKKLVYKMLQFRKNSDLGPGNMFIEKEKSLEAFNLV
jgi:hypothetical protein